MVLWQQWNMGVVVSWIGLVLSHLDEDDLPSGNTRTSICELNLENKWLAEKENGRRHTNPPTEEELDKKSVKVLTCIQQTPKWAGHLRTHTNPELCTEDV